jgi:hypothetical protein
MLHSAAFPRATSEIAALEAHAERAGAALACAFSSSAEFDAALIAARRAAGIYGPRRRRRLFVTGCGLVAGLVIIGLLAV